MKKYIFIYFVGVLIIPACTQKEAGKVNGQISNPVLPGYFADPTIKKFGDVFYIYATTDNEMLASGAPTVWYSNDLKNWYNYIMEIPSLNDVNLRNFWAPDIIEGDDGKYYLYFGNCQSGCNIYGYVSDSPVGPWEKLHEDDTPVIAHNYPVEGFPSLDAQFLKDDDGEIYAYWGTWVHYNSGYAVGRLNNQTMGEVFDAKNIPLEQTPNPFEAAYMMKKGDTYILMYSAESCHNESYKVLYSYSHHPYGPFKSGKNNPILQTNADGSVHGPGHHSVLQNGSDYYIVYHRHDFPFTAGGMSRQVCIDSLIFENDSTIRAVVPSQSGINTFVESEVPENIALKAKVATSSFYHLGTPDYDYSYLPEFAVDENNATMWKAADNTFPQSLTIDLGKQKRLKRIATQFEFATYYYQYLLEYSLDGENWEIFADRSNNRLPGSPMIDDNDVTARYIRLTIVSAEKQGVLAAVWNIKAYESLFDIPLSLKNRASENPPAIPASGKLLAGFDLNHSNDSLSLPELYNIGSLGGVFTQKGELNFISEKESEIQAIDFVKGELILDDKPVPNNLEWNGAFTVATWVKNPEVGDVDECLASWCDRTEFYLANSFNAPFYNQSNYGAMAHLDGHFDMPYKNLPEANKWHFLVFTFDGVVEKVYVDGVLDNAQNMLLSSSIRNAKIRVGASDIGEYFTGLMASFRLYDYALPERDVKELMAKTNPFKKL